jgi:cytochrome c-type biogenesis protein CcmF
MENKIQFLGENLWLGNLGHISVVLAFLSAAFGGLGYYINHKYRDNVWGKIAEKALHLHSFSVLLIIVVLYTLIRTHAYEYQYVWQHSSNDLPYYYMISCFWEGQEGSFLLWTFWHVVLAYFVYFSKSPLKYGALSVILLVQAVLTSMLLGVEWWGQKIGSSPFILLREHQPDILKLPAIQLRGIENYLSAIHDGTGLNPLLQNYWMVIHPPTLFLGFASATIPFAFLISAFWVKDRTLWMQPIIPWTLFSVMILGTGIIMGGFWAYESLSFGGYWAWDPVENASLMPWLLLIAAVHMVLIYKNTGQYAVLTMLLICFSFFFVLYATFLTRSGVLGEASVHSFTDLGLSGQLLLFMFVFIFLAIYASIHNKKNASYLIVFLLLSVLLNVLEYHFNWMGKPVLNTINVVLFGIAIFFWVKALQQQFKTELQKENPLSREFWMFIGSLVLLLSAFQIMFYTSAPVFNSLFNLNMAVQKEAFYNRFQLPFAVVIASLTAFGQFFNYRHTPKSLFIKSQLIPLVITIPISILLLILWKINVIKQLPFALLLIMSVYSIVGNASFIVTKLKGKLKLSGASIAHAGFGLMMIGILISSANKNVITYNNIGKNYVEADKDNLKAIDFNRNNMLLRRGDTLQIKDYLVFYDSNYFDGFNKIFEIQWLRFNKNGSIKEHFTLKPNTQNNPQFGFVANPDTRHYLHKDIYTHITHESSLESVEEFKNFKNDTVLIGQTFTTESGMRQLKILDLLTDASEDPDNQLYKVSAIIELTTLDKPKILTASMIINLNNNEVHRENAQSDEDGFMAELITILTPNQIDNEKVKLVIRTSERKPIVDYIIMKAIVFPWINLLWSGTIILVIGFTISIFHRKKEMKLWLKKN